MYLFCLSSRQVYTEMAKKDKERFQQETLEVCAPHRNQAGRQLCMYEENLLPASVYPDPLSC
jgi:hypothetical protein